jgi:hypothetical protein
MFGFTPLYPFAFVLALPVTAFLLWMYRRRQRGTATRVGSILLLKAFERPFTQRKNIWPPLRFLLELLIALLIITALAELTANHSRTVAILVDNSFSTFAVENPTTKQRSIDTIKEMAGGAIAELTSDTAIELFVASPTLRATAPNTLSKGSAQALLKEITPVWAEDKLERAIAELQNSARFDEIIVITDRPAAGSILTNAVRIISVNIPGAVKKNNALMSAAYQPAGINSQGGVLTVSVASFRPDESTQTITIHGAEEHGSKLTLREIRAESIRLAGFETRELRFEKIPSAAGYQITLQTVTADVKEDSRENFPAGDLIIEDNTLYLQPQTGRQALVVVTPLSDIGLGTIPTLSVQMLTPLAYKEGKNSISPDATLLLHGIVPEQLPEQSTLFIAPPPGNTLLPSTLHATDVNNALAITSWEKNHPVIAYLDLPLIRLQRMLAFASPNWMQSIARSSNGTLIAVGEKGKARYAVVGFEILPFVGRSDVTASVLLINTLQWLNQSALLSPYYSVYAPIELPKTATEMFNREGNLVWQSAVSKTAFIPTMPGLYSTPHESGAEIYAIDFHDAVESDIAHPTVVNVGFAEFTQTTRKNPQQTFTRDVLWLLFFILLADLIFFQRFLGALTFFRKVRGHTTAPTEGAL